MSNVITHFKQKKLNGFLLLLVGWPILFSLFFYSSWLFKDRLIDDTYIHLRYAHNFLNTGQFFYNQNQPSFGTSAPLYVIVLALVGQFLPLDNWPNLAKIINIVSHLVLITLFIYSITSTVKLPKHLKNIRTFTSILLVSLLLAVPSGIRWLQDGLETPITVVAALGGSVAIRYWLESPDHKNYLKAILLSFVCSLPGILRIELCLISLCALLPVLTVPKKGRKLLVISTFAFLCCWYGYIYLVMGSIIPDTAVAKNLGSFAPGWVISFMQVMLSGSPLWLVPVVLLMIALCRKPVFSNHTLYVVSGLAPITAILIYGTATNQAIQGARYFLPSLAFAWGTYLACEGKFLITFSSSLISKVQIIWISLAILLALGHCLVTWQQITGINHPDKFQLPYQLQRPGIVLLANDIGQLGWYSSAQIEDLAGLVNGHVVAATRIALRPCLLIKTMGYPDALVLLDSQARLLSDKDNITFSCDDNKKQAYSKTYEKVMSYRTINSYTEWYLWLKI